MGRLANLNELEVQLMQRESLSQVDNDFFLRLGAAYE
jgi:hypothetical protein